MNILRMKNVNFIFSLFFILWCTVHLISNSKEGSDFHKAFGYGFQEKEITIFWGAVIFLTSFNFIAHFTNRFQYYLIGAIGMITICSAQLIFVLTFVKSYMSGLSSNNSTYTDVSGRFAFILFTMPYILFGILSSLSCYHQKLNEKIDQNRTKFQRIFLKLYFINYQKINLFYHLSISTCMFGLFVMTVKFHRRFEEDMMVLLVPLIPTIFTCLAYFLNKKNFYRGTIFCWALLAIIFIFLFFGPVLNNDESRRDQIPVILSFALICFINSIVGFFSAFLTYYHEVKKIEGTFENPNYVSYTVAEDGVNF